MKAGTVCVVAALFTLLVGIILAITVAFCIPNYMVRKQHLKVYSNDTPIKIRERCKCLSEADKEELKHVHSWSAQVANRKWMQLNPSVVSVSIKKYRNDIDDTHLMYACTALVLTEYHVIGGNACLGTLWECSPYQCARFFRIRSHSQFWSTGGELRKVSAYKTSPDELVVIFTVATRFTFTGNFKKIIYPGNQLHMSRFRSIEMEEYRKKYGKTTYKEYSTNPCSGRSSRRISKIERSVVVYSPVVSFCNELTGFNTFTVILNMRHYYYQNWITQFSNAKIDESCCDNITVVYAVENDCGEKIILCNV